MGRQKECVFKKTLNVNKENLFRVDVFEQSVGRNDHFALSDFHF